jgi:N6-adenosine-specific RNA methylase IME4
MEKAIQLTLFDYKEMPLAELEGIIERGLVTFIEVGLALLAIREGEKYKDAGYTDFNVYIEERWGMSHNYGLEKLNAGYISSEIVAIATISPTHEAQVRPLCRLGTKERPEHDWPQPECWIDAWSRACDLAGENGEPALPTAKEVKFIVDQMLWQEPPPIPPGKYRVIYADPPWQYGDKLIEGYGAAEHHYPSMSIDALCELPIKGLAADNSVLFLWVTSPMLAECFEVINTWGFEYKASFVWDKVKHNFGHYNSVRHELLLLCTRGSCVPENSELFDSVQQIERSPEHSEKPEEFRRIIEALYTHGPYLELFGRKKVEGWEVWGNAIG